MSLDKNTKDSIKMYILQLILESKIDVIKKTQETFSISSTTVYRYINELLKNGIIEKQLIKNKKKYVLKSESFIKSYYPNKDKLEEDVVYSNDFEKFITDYPKNIQKIWNYSFTEMMNNALEHADSTKIICCIFQNYLRTLIVIIDNGIGIFNKIQAYNKEVLKIDITLEEACSKLFAGKLTTDVLKHSGEGIFFTSRIVDHFLILSSNRKFTHNVYIDCINEDKRVNDMMKKILKQNEGTAVYMSLSNFSSKHIEEVFNMFSDPNKGFFKTQIPIKMMFENGYPVSRSQAKRLYNGFDKFDEIVLDFKDIESIGQAFAHEMFVVYKIKNPNKKIIFENANDNVKKMINMVENTEI